MLYILLNMIMLNLFVLDNLFHFYFDIKGLNGLGWWQNLSNSRLCTINFTEVIQILEAEIDMIITLPHYLAL